MRSVVVGVAAVLAVAACGQTAGGNQPAAAPAPPATTAAALVRSTIDAKLGQVLVDSQGRTLYLFMPERGDHVACTGGCTTTWIPVLVTAASPLASATPLPGQLGMVARPDGTQQATYDQWPLYRFAGDQKPGDSQGEGVGGQWFAVPVDGSWDLPTPTPSPPPPPAAPPVAAAPPPPVFRPPPPTPVMAFNDRDSDNFGGRSDGDGNG